MSVNSTQRWYGERAGGLYSRKAACAGQGEGQGEGEGEGNDQAEAMLLQTNFQSVLKSRHLIESEPNRRSAPNSV